MTDENKITPEKRKKSPRNWHRARLGVQIVVFLLFLYLLLGTTQQLNTFLPPELFFHLDPLAGISSMLASRTWIAPMALGAVVLVLAVVFGRVWCSWICPMGSLLDWIPSHKSKRNEKDIPSYWRQGKYFFLFIVLVAAVFGSLTLVILDPITLLFRSITSAVLPVLELVIRGVETLTYNITPLQPAVEWFDNLVRGWLITGQSFFLPNLLILLLFAGVLAVNAVRSRFWCRYLCPLGGLLALFSRIARVRHTVDEAKCISCQCCARICHTGAIDSAKGFAASAAECTSCMECVEACPTNAISFSRQAGFAAQQVYDPARRRFLATLGVAAAGALLLRFVPVVRGIQQKLIRPPGTTEEKLLNQCIRCGECVKVCPTKVIQPDISVGGLENTWTPALQVRRGYCDYSCNSCGQVCPTNAIPALSLEQKRQSVIGKAVIDRNRCIPWVDGIDCGVCEEVCPVAGKAISFSGGGGGGRRANAKRPHEVPDLCIGCGICENQCPVAGESAIRILPPDRIS